MALLLKKKHIVNSQGEEEELSIYTTKTEAVDTVKPCKVIQVNVDGEILTGYIGYTDELDTKKASSKRLLIDGKEYAERKYMGIKDMQYYMRDTYPATYQTITEITEDMIPDTSDCTNMFAMFYECRKAETLPNVDTRNCVTFNAMFGYCTNVKYFPQIDTSKSTQLGYLYRGCSNAVKVSDIDFSKVASNNSSLNGVYTELMFEGCSSLRSITFNNLPIGTTEATLRSKCAIPSTVTEIIMNFREV